MSATPKVKSPYFGLRAFKRTLREAGWTDQGDGYFINPFGEVRVDRTRWKTGYVVVRTPTQVEFWPRRIANLVMHFFDHKWRG